VQSKEKKGNWINESELCADDHVNSYLKYSSVLYWKIFSVACVERLAKLMQFCILDFFIVARFG
jgi:hypothetical protein